MDYIFNDGIFSTTVDDATLTAPSLSQLRELVSQRHAPQPATAYILDDNDVTRRVLFTGSVSTDEEGNRLWTVKNEIMYDYVPCHPRTVPPHLDEYFISEIARRQAAVQDARQHILSLPSDGLNRSKYPEISITTSADETTVTFPFSSLSPILLIMQEKDGEITSSFLDVPLTAYSVPGLVHQAVRLYIHPLSDRRTVYAIQNKKIIPTPFTDRYYRIFATHEQAAQFIEAEAAVETAKLSLGESLWEEIVKVGTPV